MLIGIDGTGSGPFNPSDLSGMLPSDEQPGYYSDMKTSFVRELVQEYHGPWGSNYFRGPTYSGEECGQIAAACMTLVEAPIRSGTPIYLTGYSRGGAIAIEVAKRIRSQFPGVRIPVMALFDAVDRELTFGDLQLIPGNVDIAFHARRDRLVGSRVYFGNCGTDAESGCKLVQMTFVTTHGGMGGVPWASAPPVQGVFGTIDYLAEQWSTHGQISGLLAFGSDVATGQVAKITYDYWLGASSVPSRIAGALLGPPGPTSSFGSPAFGKDTEKLQSEKVHTWMWANLRKQGVIH